MNHSNHNHCFNKKKGHFQKEQDNKRNPDNNPYYSENEQLVNTAQI